MDKRCSVYWCDKEAKHVWECLMEVYSVEVGFCDSCSQWMENEPLMDHLGPYDDVVRPDRR